MPVGVVKWFNENKGYGFITPDGGEKDVFVHATGIKGAGHQNLREASAWSSRSSRGPRAPRRGASRRSPKAVRNKSRRERHPVSPVAPVALVTASRLEAPRELLSAPWTSTEQPQGTPRLGDAILIPSPSRGTMRGGRGLPEQERLASPASRSGLVVNSSGFWPRLPSTGRPDPPDARAAGVASIESLSHCERRALRRLVRPRE